MIMAKINTDEPVILQVLPQELDGSPRTELTLAKVRVYHIADGVEVEDLTSTDLVYIPASNAWRYIWEPETIEEGHYFAEYTITGVDEITAVGIEDIIIGSLGAPTVTEIDDKLTDEHGDGSWQQCPTAPGHPSAIPGE